MVKQKNKSYFGKLGQGTMNCEKWKRQKWKEEKKKMKKKMKAVNTIAVCLGLWWCFSWHYLI